MRFVRRVLSVDTLLLSNRTFYRNPYSNLGVLTDGQTDIRTETASTL